MRNALAILILLLGFAPGYAGVEDADSSEERSRASFIDQFSKFMQDKNVQGRAKTPDGKVVGGGKKTRFNQDDGLAFQSDLTYHDYAFNTIEQSQNKGDKNKDAQDKRLFAFVSAHGGVSAGGGSSVLERTAYGLDQQLSKQDEQNKNLNEQEGVKYRSIFKVTTKEVFDQQAQGAATGDAAKEGEKEKVDRFELRQEARPAIDKVGEDSADTIIQAARGEENANDPQTLGNGVLLRMAAFEATKALWNSVMANLGQRRINRAIRSGAMPVAPQLSEGVPRCGEWQTVAQDVVNQTRDPKKKQELMQEIQRMSDQCNQVAALPIGAVGPKFTQDGGKNETLQMEGAQKEDAFQRDSRLQLEIMAKAGKSVTELPSNWQYTAEDDKARMTISYDDNQPKQGALTVRQQIDSYNANLKSAEEGYQEVAKLLNASSPNRSTFNPSQTITFEDIPSEGVRGTVGSSGDAPEFRVPKPTDFAIAVGTKNIIEINQPPESAFEEVGMQNGTNTGPIPQNYNDLLRNSQTN